MALMPVSKIKCPIDIKDFPQYSGFEQFQQVIAIEAPVVYDQCLLKKCLMDKYDPRLYGSNPICPPNSYTVVDGLRMNLGWSPSDTKFELRQFRNFDLNITNVSTSKISATQKSVTITYEISFKADVLINGESYNTTDIYIPNLTETTILNCPDSLSEIYVSTTTGGQSVNEPIFKLAMLPDLANSTGYLVKYSWGSDAKPAKYDDPEIPVGHIGNSINGYPPFLSKAPELPKDSEGKDPKDPKRYYYYYVMYLNLCYSLMIKCELESQVLVPFYGFYSEGKKCQNLQDTCPCVQCLNNPIGTFYPPIDFSVFQCGNTTKSIDANVVDDITENMENTEIVTPL